MEKIISKRILKIANYIFSKELDNQEFTKSQYEIIEYLTTINDIKPNAVECFKFIYENRNNPEKITEFMKCIERWKR